MHLGFEYRPIADDGYVDKRVIIATGNTGFAILPRCLNHPGIFCYYSAASQADCPATFIN